jgi:glycosyltransferase involved in cell wall biosynthesis
MSKKVSILIPAYNAEKWIVQTIGSALDQYWRDIEIIIVDDGSTDQTYTIARRFENRICKVITQPNQGVSAARNMAMQVAQGDYIQWLDADDILAPNKISEQMKVTDDVSDMTLLSCGWAHFYTKAERAKIQRSELWADLKPVEWLLLKMNYNLHMQTGNWLVSRKLTEISGPFNTSLLRDNDGEYFARVITRCNSIKFVEKALVFYRIAGLSSVSFVGYSDKKLDSLFLSMQLHMRYIRCLENSVRVNEACLRYLQNWLVFFYPERPDIVSKANCIARSIGGSLSVPRLPFKYDLIRKVFGWRLAKRVWLYLPQIRIYLERLRERFI